MRLQLLNIALNNQQMMNLRWVFWDTMLSFRINLRIIHFYAMHIYRVIKNIPLIKELSQEYSFIDLHKKTKAIQVLQWRIKAFDNFQCFDHSVVKITHHLHRMGLWNLWAHSYKLHHVEIHVCIHTYLHWHM